jgi:hypothetical protein
VCDHIKNNVPRAGLEKLKTDLDSLANRITTWAVGAIVFTAAISFAIGRYVH